MEKLEQERHTRTGRTLAILYGLYVMNFGESSDPRVLVELAQEAEQSGWNGFFLTDALMYHADGHEPATDTFVGLAAIASRTSRIRIGSAIAVLPRRLPWQVAREAAAIDQLSNGRLILGVGIGGETEVEYGRFGQKITPTVLGERLDESLDIITDSGVGKRSVITANITRLKVRAFRQHQFNGHAFRYGSVVHGLTSLHSAERHDGTVSYQ